MFHRMFIVITSIESHSDIPLSQNRNPLLNESYSICKLDSIHAYTCVGFSNFYTTVLLPVSVA